MIPRISFPVRLAIICFITYVLTSLSACIDGDDLPKTVKITGRVTGTDASGEVFAMHSLPLIVKLYKAPFSIPDEVDVTTDSQGNYELVVDTKKYVGYWVTDQEVVYEPCGWTVGPLAVEGYFNLKAKNEYDISLCIVSSFLIVANKVSASNTLHILSSAQIGSVFFSRNENTVFDNAELYIPYYASATEIEFTFTIRNNGNVVNTITETRSANPGSVQTINVEF